MTDEYEQSVDELARQLEDDFALNADRAAANVVRMMEIDALNERINKGTLQVGLASPFGANMYQTGWSDPRGVFMGTAKIQQRKPDYNICFHQDNQQIGKLDFNGDMLKFEGNADESAMKFIEHLSTQWRSRLDEEHRAAARMLIELMAVELSDEMELDDAYRKGFNDAMQAARALLLRKVKQLEES